MGSYRVLFFVFVESFIIIIIISNQMSLTFHTRGPCR
jgi:hypothetical protein